MVGSTAFFVAMMLADAAAGGTQAPVATNPEDRVICRKQLETGSLVKGKRICHTRKEWARLADEGRRDAEELSIAKNGVNSSN